MEFRILGPLEVVGEHGVVIVEGRTQRALLVLLLMNAGKLVSVDRLIDDLWNGSGSVKAVQVAVARLRSSLGARSSATGVVTRERGYLLELCESDVVDQVEFARGVDEGRRFLAERQPERALACLAEALALWRGPPFAGFSDEQWAMAEAHRLEELRALAFEAQVDAALSLGRHDAMIPELERLTRLYPDRERVRTQLMLALYRAGRQADALHAFHDARRHFIEEYGIEPSEELRALHQAILSQDPALMSVPFARGIGRDGPNEPAPKVPLPSRVRPYGPARFVGRQRELTVLTTTLATVADGQRATVLVTGEPGVGKTRLVSEVAAGTSAAGTLVLAGRCDDRLGLAYQPFVEAIQLLVEYAPRGLLVRHRAEYGLALGRLVPPLAHRLGEPVDHASTPSEAERYALFAAIDALLASAAASPTLLVLEDMHWADAATILLLRYILTSPRTAQLAIVVTLRRAELDGNEPLVQLLDDLSREPSVARLDLPGLSRDEVRALARDLSRRSLDPDECARADQLCLSTKGNPFFIAELLRSRSGSRDDSSSPTPGLPETVLSVLRRRLDRVGQASQGILQLVAMTPGGAPTDVLARADRSGWDVVEAIDAGCRAGVLHERRELGTTIVDFVHPLFRDAIESQTGTARRAQLHLRIADAMNGIAAAIGERWLSELAYHTFAAGRMADPQRVTQVCLQAGDAAMAATAFDAAAAHYEQVLEAMSWLSAVSAADRCAVTLRCAEAHHGTGDAAACRRMAEVAFEDAAATGQPRVMAYAGLVHGGARSTYGVPSERTMEMLADGLRALEGHADAALRARVTSRLAQEHYHVGQFDLADQLSADAVTQARMIGADQVLAATMEGRIWALHRPEKLPERLELTEEMVARAASADDGEQLIVALIWRSCAQLEAGSVEQVDADLAALDALTAKLPIPSRMFRVMTMRATRAIMAGDYDRGAQFAQDTFRVGASIEPENAKQTLAAQLLPMLREQGALSSLAAQAGEMAAAYPAAPGWRCAAALVQLEAGERARARVAFDEIAQAGFDCLPRDLAWLLAHCYLAEVAAGLEDAAAATELYQRLLPYGDRNAAVFDIASLGSVQHHLGLLARTAARPEPAARHFEEAIAFNDRTGQWPAAARSRYEYGRLLCATERPWASMQPLGEALEMATRLKLTRLLAQVKDLTTDPVPSRAATT